MRSINLLKKVKGQRRSLAYLTFLFVFFTSCKGVVSHLSKITADTIAIDSTITTSSNVDNIIIPYKKKLDTEMQQVLSFAPIELQKNDGVMQSSLGNLLADMCFEMANTTFKEKTNKTIDFAMFNHGGIRSIISQGNVTKEDVFKLMPFENELVVTTLPGTKVIELVDYFIDSKRAHPLSKQIQLIIDGDDYTLKINDNVFQSNKTYNVLTNDYLQNGGSNMLFFKDPVALTRLNYKVRDAIIDYFKKVDTLQTAIDDRIIIKQ